jgi:phage-related protein
MTGRAKGVEFLGTALADLRAFPTPVRREAGYQLDRVQQGLAPDDWKAIPSVGPGVREIRVREAAGAFRVIYLATVGDLLYVLHCFQKKSQKTSRPDLDLARRRYKELMKELRR